MPMTFLSNISRICRLGILNRAEIGILGTDKVFYFYRDKISDINSYISTFTFFSQTFLLIHVNATVFGNG